MTAIPSTMTDSTAVAAPPTAQEALAALRTLADYATPFDDQVRGPVELAVGAQAAHDELKTFISAAAAEADAWAKIEAWCKANPLFEITVYVDDNGRWVARIGDASSDLLDFESMWECSTRLSALQLAAAWCEKEGA